LFFFNKQGDKNRLSNKIKKNKNQPTDTQQLGVALVPGLTGTHIRASLVPAHLMASTWTGRTLIDVHTALRTSPA